MFKIYIVEDDRTISRILKEKLDKWNYETHEVSDFKDVFLEYGKIAPHLVLMDINLPYYDGFYWCEKIRQSSNVPIIFISSRGDDRDKIRAITGGADDYVEKPFSTDVMLAKIQAVLRRAYSYGDTSYNIVSYKDMVLDLEKAAVSAGGREAVLARNESIILTLLIKAAGKTVSRAGLIKALWEDEHFVDENTLTVNVNRLRKKLAQIKNGDIIGTVKKEGYRLL
jgi:DNA-binding response OmpR family regulator